MLCLKQDRPLKTILPGFSLLLAGVQNGKTRRTDNQFVVSLPTQ
jgi:hypothetical protein